MASFGQINNEGEVRGTTLAPINMNPIEGFMGGILASQTRAMGKNGAEIGEMWRNMHNYRIAKEAQAEMDEVQRQAEEEAREGMTSAPGSPKSWYMKDGTMDKDKVADFESRYREAYDGVKPTFWGVDATQKFTEDKDNRMRNSANRLYGQAMAGQFEATKRVADAAVENAERKGDMGALSRELQRQVSAGIKTQVEAENVLMKAAKSRVGGGGSINIGGNNVGGFNAQLLAAAARDGERVLTPEEYDSLAMGGGSSGELGRTGDITLDGVERVQLPDYVSGAQPDKYVQESTTDGNLVERDKDITLMERGELAGHELEVDKYPEYTPGQAWAYTGDTTKVLQAMTNNDYDAVQQRLGERNNTVTLRVDNDGNGSLEAGVNTPDSVKAIVAGANENKGLSQVDAVKLAEQICNYQAIGTDLSADAMAASIKDLYPVLGGGNENVGKAEAKSIAQNCRARAGKENPRIMTEDAIKTMAEMTVRSGGYRTDEEGNELDFAFFERVYNRNVKNSKEKVEWERPGGVIYDNEEEKLEQADWDRAFSHFQEHADEYFGREVNPTQDLFESHGRDYVKWYYETYGKEDEKMAYDAEVADLVSDIHIAQRRNMKPDKEQNYASDVDIARDVCASRSGVSLRTRSNLEAYSKRIKSDMALAQRMVQTKRGDYEQALKKLDMQGEVNAEEKKKQKQAEKLEAKAEKDKEKEQERIQMAKYLTERMKPVTIDWVSDNVDRGNFGGMLCRLPESELKRIRETMGYDETQTVAAKIDGIGTNIVVDMRYPARGNAIEFSSAVVAKLQDKPTGRGKKKVIPPLKRRGKVGIHYIFKKAPTE